MDIQNRLYMAFIGVDELPIQPFLYAYERQSRFQTLLSSSLKIHLLR